MPPEMALSPGRWGTPSGKYRNQKKSKMFSVFFLGPEVQDNGPIELKIGVEQLWGMYYISEDFTKWDAISQVFCQILKIKKETLEIVLAVLKTL